jgi:hypothetical protein
MLYFKSSIWSNVTPTIEQSAPKECLAKAVPSVGPPEHAVPRPFIKKPADPDRPKRTVGLRLVDALVYPVINNFGVFAISVGATYLTEHGAKVGKDGSALRAVGEWFNKRGIRFKDGMKKHFNASEKTADMTKMVFFSFFDGTFVAPFVKILEDRREKMAEWFDDKLNTKPTDLSVYKAEPKQTWGSVGEGRLLTSAIIVPIAATLDQNKVQGRTLNEWMFDVPSKHIAKWFDTHTNVKHRFPKLEVPYLSKTIVFEAFYTSVCTACLYFISRAIAKHTKANKEAVAEYKEHHKRAVISALQTEDMPEQQPKQETSAAPKPQVSSSAYEARLQPVRTQEVTA